MSKPTLHKIPDHWSGRNAYEIRLDGEVIGSVRRGSAAPTYWGSWEGYGVGVGRVISDSRKSVVNQVVAAVRKARS